MTNIETKLEMTLIEDIGSDEGKNSIVKRAADHQLDGFFAVKIIPKSKFVEEFGENHRHQFFNEAKIIYNNKHPNIVKIQHATSCEDNVYYTMPYYKNGSLNRLISNRYLTVREIVKISLEFLSGVHYIHTNDLVHFDIKPTNIMFNDNGKAMLTDFGLSRYTDDYGVARFTKLYTSHYPPECINKNITTKQADIYQAGITLYRMCNGNVAFNKQFEEIVQKKGIQQLAKHISSEKFPERKYLPHIPSRLRRIVTKSLKCNPDERYSTAIELMNELSKVDTMLDIRFKKKDDVFIWECDNALRTSTDYVYLKKIDEMWQITGKKRNNCTGNTSNIRKIEVKDIPELQKGLKVVEKILKEQYGG
jgi:serine/threonine protein kinase